MKRSVLFLTGSARANGNSLRLARAASFGLPVDADPHWIDLHQMALPAFQDLRPSAPAVPSEDLLLCLEGIKRASALVFVAPIYWYGLPAPLHLLMSHWSGWLDNTSLGFHGMLKDKPIALITARADPDPTVPELAEAMVRRSAVWLGMRWSGALHGVGEKPGDVETCPSFSNASTFLQNLLPPAKTGVS